MSASAAAADNDTWSNRSAMSTFSLGSNVSNSSGMPMLISKLVDANGYPTFKQKMKIMLEGHEVWDVIVGPELSPQATDAEKKEWVKKDKKAKMMILLGLSDSLLRMFANAENSKKLWCALEEQFQPRNVSTTHIHMQNLIKLKLREGGNLMEHIALFKFYGDKLAELDNGFKDSMLAHLLLTSLPPSYQTIVMITMKVDEKTFSFNYVRECLIQNLSFRNAQEASHQHEENDIETAMAVQSYKPQHQQQQQQRKMRGQGGPQQQQQRRCFNCGSTDHLIANCPNKARHKSDSSTKSTEQAHQVRSINTPSQSVTQASNQDDANNNIEICFMMRSSNHNDDQKVNMNNCTDAFLDTAASNTMTPNLSALTNTRKTSRSAVVGDNRVVPALCEGDLVLSSSTGEIIIHDVMYVPSLANTLISVGQLAKSGYNTMFDNKSAKIWSKDKKLVLEAELGHDTMYRISNVCVGLPKQMALTIRAIDARIHYRMGHVGASTLARLVKEKGALGLPDDLKIEKFDCEGCVYGKQTRLPFTSTSSSSVATQCLELTHTDIGVVRDPTGNGYTYWCLFLDDYSGYVVSAILKNKSDVLTAFKQYKKYSELKFHPLKLKRVRSDNGGEYIGDFARYLAECGIVHELTTPYTPQWNGKVECYNGVYVRMTRAQLHHMFVPPRFWTEAFKTSIYIGNRLISRTAHENKTPFEFCNNRKPNLSHLRVFGCVAYAHVQKKQAKFDPRAIKCMMVGYCDTSRAWRLWEPKSNKYIRSRDVTFFEDTPFFNHNSSSDNAIGANQEEPMIGGVIDHYPEIEDIKSPNEAPVMPNSAAMPDIVDREADIDVNDFHDADHVGGDDGADYAENNDVDPQQEAPISVNEDLSEEEENYASIASESESATHTMSASTHSDVASDYDISATVQHDSLSAPRIPTSSSSQQAQLSASERGPRYPARNRTRPGKWWISEHANVVMTSSNDDVKSTSYECIDDEPRHVNEAFSRHDAEMWKAACMEELESQQENKSWDLVPRDPNIKVLRSQWVFKIKRKANGKIDKYKARLCVDGSKQTFGVNYTETYAPVVKMTTIRILLAIVALYDLELHQMDVKTAFLNGVLNELIHMEQPPGFIKGGRDMVCQLNKAIYGLRQSSRVWYLTIAEFLAKLGFKRVESDYGLFVNWTATSKCLISLYVDDLLIACNSMDYLVEVKHKLSQEYKMTDLGEAGYILGIQLHRDRARRQIFLSQSHYLERVLERFRMSDCKPVSTPIENQSMMVAHDGVVDVNLRSMYQSAVGSLMYAMTCTRPDLAFAVGLVSRFSSNPSDVHWAAIKRILRYVRGSAQLRLCLGAPCATDSMSNLVVGYCDADWAADKVEYKSTSGYVFYLGSGPISWRSKRQTSVALSTAEAEYMSASVACQEALWIKELLKQIGIDVSKPITMFSDNQSAIAMGENPGQHNRTKHILIRYHFIRDQIEKGSVNLSYCPTQDNVADVFTKGLAKVKHNTFVNKLGLMG